jgi:hypothetical protein
VPGFRRFSAQGASRDERPELDPFAGVPDERYELSASELLGRLLEPGVRLVHVEDAYITGLLDLRAVDAAFELHFERCRFEQPPDVRLASLVGLRFLSMDGMGPDADGFDTLPDQSPQGCPRPRQA